MQAMASARSMLSRRWKKANLGFVGTEYLAFQITASDTNASRRVSGPQSFMPASFADCTRSWLFRIGDSRFALIRPGFLLTIKPLKRFSSAEAEHAERREQVRMQMANWRYAFLPDFLYGFLTGFVVTPKVRKVSAIQDQRC